MTICGAISRYGSRRFSRWEREEQLDKRSDHRVTLILEGEKERERGIARSPIYSSPPRSAKYTSRLIDLAWYDVFYELNDQSLRMKYTGAFHLRTKRMKEVGCKRASLDPLSQLLTQPMMVGQVPPARWPKGLAGTFTVFQLSAPFLFLSFSLFSAPRTIGSYCRRYVTHIKKVV